MSGKIRSNASYYLAAIGAMILSALALRAWDPRLDRELVEPCPSGMAPVSLATGRFCLDLYEAAPSSRCPYQSPETSVQGRANFDFAACLPQSAAGRVPWTNVSRDMAEALCRKAGKRLPSAVEWQAAALGQTASACNLAGNGYWLSGNSSDCRSPSGHFDLIGNVWEWVSDETIDGRLVAGGRELPDSGFISSMAADAWPDRTATSAQADYDSDRFWLKKQGRRAAAKGGYWASADEAGAWATYAVNTPSESSSGVGFRCVSDIKQ